MNIHDIDTVMLDADVPVLRIIDQTLLPGRVEILSLTERDEMFEAIKSLRVRGAPAIGAAAGAGLYVLAALADAADFSDWHRAVAADADYLASSRPTAVNLKWALDRMLRALDLSCVSDISQGRAVLLREARAIIAEDIEMCRAIGENALTLLRDGMGILTHCNAGKLATIRYGTATSPLYLGARRGMRFRIYADETRPLLQGARLTAFELYAAGLDVTLQCDNMAASAMAQGLVDAVITGADRVAANGDTANKIGTLGLAVMARHFDIPFYICAPSSTVDMATRDGGDIVVEQRDPDEVTELWYKSRMAPPGVKVRNPAFDVTPGSLITAIVTERGIARAPYSESLRALMEG